MKESDDINLELIDKYISELPLKDTNSIGGIFLDYDMGSHLADTGFDGIDVHVWNKWGDGRTKRFLRKKIRENKERFIYYDPAWEKDKLAQKDTLYHEVGHIVFDDLPKGKSSDREFWMNAVDIEGISREDVKASIKSGRSQLIFEYFSDHYAAYHLGEKVPDDERKWFDDRYSKIRSEGDK